jgi:hypothetical protein
MAEAHTSHVSTVVIRMKRERGTFLMADAHSLYEVSLTLNFRGLEPKAALRRAETCVGLSDRGRQRPSALY